MNIENCDLCNNFLKSVGGGIRLNNHQNGLKTDSFQSKSCFSMLEKQLGCTKISLPVGEQQIRIFFMVIYLNPITENHLKKAVL